MNVAALEDVAPDDSDHSSLKDTGDSRHPSEEAGLEDIAAPLRRNQRIRKKTRKGKDF